MILDAQLQFSAAQAITAAAASTNYVDASEARNIGVGKELYVATIVTTAFTDGGTNAGLQVSLYGDSTSTFTPDGSQLLYTLPKNAAIGSGPYYGVIAPDAAGAFEFLVLQYTPVTANLTAGAVSSYLTTNIAAFKAYAKGYVVS